MVLSDTVDGGAAEIPVSPRTILKGQVGRAAGRLVKAGSEFEYYVLRDLGGAQPEGCGIPKRFGDYNEDYHLLQATKAEPLHRLLRNQMTEAAVPIEFSKGEAAPGQHEVNIRYDHVLESADRSVLFKHGARDRLPQRLGHHVHGQARPRLDRLIGASAHVPWDNDGRHPSTNDPEAGCPTDLEHRLQPLRGRDDGAPRRARRLHRADINRYKRYASLSWAPVNVVWGRDNRTTGFRLVGRGSLLHVEDRFPGGDMKAYLTYAAMIGAGPTESSTSSARRRVQG